MLKVTKNMRNYLKAKLKKKKSFNSSLESVHIFMLRIVEGNAFQR